MSHEDGDLLLGNVLQKIEGLDATIIDPTDSVGVLRESIKTLRSHVSVLQAGRIRKLSLIEDVENQLNFLKDSMEDWDTLVEDERLGEDILRRDSQRLRERYKAVTNKYFITQEILIKMRKEPEIDVELDIPLDTVDCIPAWQKVMFSLYRH